MAVRLRGHADVSLPVGCGNSFMQLAGTHAGGL
jgi:hypothetical protein